MRSRRRASLTGERALTRRPDHRPPAIDMPANGEAHPTGKQHLGVTVRSRSPAETLARVRPLFPAVGITRLANVTGLDRIGIPVWLCVRPNGRCLSVSQGKGLTTELAQVSAVMESIEMHHAERVREPEMTASYRDARRHHDLVDPEDLMPGICGRAYRPTRRLAWVRGTDVASGRTVFVPHAWVDLDQSRPHPDAGLFFVTSTGLASGNDRVEALCHGVLEIVERDSEWRWTRLSPAAQHRRQLDAGTIASPLLQPLLEQFARAGILVRMWDMTSSVGLPTYGCALSDPRALGGLDPAYGVGCHLSKEIALARALTEAAQNRLTFIAGSRDDVFPWLYDAVAYALPAERLEPGPVDFRARRSPREGATLDEDLLTILRLLARAGFARVVAVDHTRPEFGIPVVTVVVPGMRQVR